MSGPVRTRLERVAWAALAAHAALSTFSAVAFATFLSGPPPAWLLQPANQRAMALGWRFGPQTTVVLGALAGLAWAAGRFGRGRAVVMFAVAFVVSLASELSGTSTGWPFGPYGYTDVLGYKVLGLVPFNIPTSWFYMLVCSLAITARLRRGDAASPWRWALVAGVVLTAWDVSMDPAMVRTSHWLWHLPQGDGRPLLTRLFVSDAFYGMPLSNWLGWLLTGTVVARLMLAVVSPAAWTRHATSSRFPLLLYGVNGVLPITICARNGLWWATVWGTVAMALPLWLATRASAPAAARVADGAAEPRLDGRPARAT